ncbi:flavodoxin domain-containing protein [Pseudonocardia sp.]|uniref:flavodoxin domain-containing protein n=1 Tax=Pseudonocardia sp. TaxID=60912 RepID=UPI003D0F19D0
MRILVAYAGVHGATRSIAERIADRLRRAGLDADLRPAHEVGSVAGHDAIVLGSAIHDGQWLPEAAELAGREAAALADHPAWLFSVGMVGDRSSSLPRPVARMLRSRQPVPDAVAAAVRAGVLAGRHHRFTGVFLREHTGRNGALLYRAMGGRFGDHRDWDDVHGWADSIAAALVGERAGR